MADLLLDSSIVEEQVRRLNRQADSLGFLGVVVGLVPGAALGALPLFLHSPIPSKFGFATLLLGALAGGGLGYMFGSSRAFGYRLRGQVMLGQLRLEQNVEALLAVSERPVPALPNPQPVHALPQAPRIEEIIQAGLAMPAAPPVVDVAPAVEAAPVAHEEVAPLPALEHVEHVMPVAVEQQPEPEPEPAPESHETLLPPAPSWAAALEQVLAPLAPEPVATPEPVKVPEPVAFPEPVAPPAPEPVVAHEPEPAPAWSLPEPVHDEPAAATTPSWSFAPPAEPEPVAVPEEEPAPAPEPLRPDFGSTMPSWAAPAPAPDPAPVAEIEEEHAPAPEPLRPDFGSTVPAWAVPAPAPEPAPEPEAEPVPPAAHTDLSALSIAEIARLADAGSL